MLCVVCRLLHACSAAIVPVVEGCVGSGAVHIIVTELTTSGLTSSTLLLLLLLLLLTIGREGILVGGSVGLTQVRVVWREGWRVDTCLTGASGVWSLPWVGTGATATAASHPVLGLVEVHLLLNLLSLLLGHSSKFHS